MEPIPILRKVIISLIITLVLLILFVVYTINVNKELKQYKRAYHCTLNCYTNLERDYYKEVDKHN